MDCPTLFLTWGPSCHSDLCLSSDLRGPLSHLLSSSHSAYVVWLKEPVSSLTREREPQEGRILVVLPPTPPPPPLSPTLKSVWHMTDVKYWFSDDQDYPRIFSLFLKHTVTPHHCMVTFKLGSRKGARGGFLYLWDLRQVLWLF